jgi:hypothetical protein
MIRRGGPVLNIQDRAAGLLDQPGPGMAVGTSQPFASPEIRKDLIDRAMCYDV